MMNCGYDPAPGGTVRPAADRPADVARLPHRRRAARRGRSSPRCCFAGGRGRASSCRAPIHEAVAKSTEVDLMSWVMRRVARAAPDLPSRAGDHHAASVHRAHQGRPLGDGQPGHAPGGDGAARRAARALRHGGRPRRREADACPRADGSFPAPGRARPSATTAWRPCSASCAPSPTRTCRGARPRRPACSGRRCASRTRTRMDPHWLARAELHRRRAPRAGPLRSATPPASGWRRARPGRSAAGRRC